MHVKKGDTVLVITGKDQGAQARSSRSTRSPSVSSSRASTGSRSTPRSVRPPGARRPAASSPRRRRSTSPTSSWSSEIDGKTGRHPHRCPLERGRHARPRDRSPSAPVRTSDEHRPRRPLRRRHRGSRRATAPRSRRRCWRSSVCRNVMQVPGLVKIVVNMGVGEAARDSKLIEGAIRDLAAITGQKPQVTQGAQVHRAVQASRGHADRRPRDAARRPHVGVPRPASVGRAPAHPRLPRPVAAVSSTAAATTPSVSTSSRCSTRSTRTRSTASAAWTSRSSRPRRSDDEGRALLKQLGFPFKEN